jgi:hypothetical protein
VPMAELLELIDTPLAQEFELEKVAADAASGRAGCVLGLGVGIKEMARQPYLCRIFGRGKIGFRAQRKRCARLSATRGDVSASHG